MASITVGDLSTAVLPIPFVMAVAAAVCCSVWAWQAPNLRTSLRGEGRYFDRWWSYGGGCGILLFWLGGQFLSRTENPCDVMVHSCVAGASIAAMLALVWAFWRRKKGPQPAVLSRGALLSGFETMCRRAGAFHSGSVYLLPEGASALRAGNYFLFLPINAVYMPRRLLDWMSRAEIDALFAYQIYWNQSARGVMWTYWGAVLFGLMVSLVLKWTDVGLLGHGVALVVLLAAEVIALAVLISRASSRAVLHAAEITGDPEAYLSAMARLGRMERGVASALQEQPRPTSDRYPTSGEYVEVGF